MASSNLKIPIQTPPKRTPLNPSNPLPKTLLPPLPTHLLPHSHLSLSPTKPLFTTPQTPLSSLQNSSNPLKPPTTKEQAILQLKSCLSSSLSKPLNNPALLGRLKKPKQQPRFQVELPVIDDSPDSLSSLVFDVFADLPIKRKGGPVRILVLWPSIESTFASGESSNAVENSVLDEVEEGSLSSADVVVFAAPEADQVEMIRRVCDGVYTKPVVVLNPKWESFIDGEKALVGFLGSFDVVYSFMGLEVRGLLSKRKGVVFKSGREDWVVFVEVEDGELKAVSKFKRRPSIGEVETVLYNVMAATSPITKSVKFIRDLATNVTGKKER
ncbi:hypothetical protein QJS04_geneDACA019822 [Acorus gramineus]|uniref:DUF1995 domain-containing protein n=1 Tax=Acorus gramineus TaxID=55184 RepID=A0AAV9BV11_ACOGR|nr:hypothetical protein QJS04_geneDACA019822 [Acorus gramineus]